MVQWFDRNNHVQSEVVGWKTELMSCKTPNHVTELKETAEFKLPGGILPMSNRVMWMRLIELQLFFFFFTLWLSAASHPICICKIPRLHAAYEWTRVCGIVKEWVFAFPSSEEICAQQQTRITTSPQCKHCVYTDGGISHWNNAC